MYIQFLWSIKFCRYSAGSRVRIVMSVNTRFAPPDMGEPWLLTPGPLTTAIETKQAMLRDWGSWDDDFRAMTLDLRQQLLAMLNDPGSEFDCVPIQGSGTFVVEAMLGSLLPAKSNTLVLSNGAYGRRIVEILDYIGRKYTLIDKGDYLPPRAGEVNTALKADPTLSHVVAVHCETSSGILNPIEEIAEAVQANGRKLLIDSMSTFGAIELGQLCSKHWSPPPTNASRVFQVLALPLYVNPHWKRPKVAVIRFVWICMPSGQR